MQALAKAGLNEYLKRKEAEQNFTYNTERIKELLEFDGRETANDALLFLKPLISIAWTDGRVGRSEQDAIMRAAESYGIFGSEQHYVSLMQDLVTRPHASAIALAWDELAECCREMKAPKAAAVASHLYQQIKYVGELSEKYTFGFWRGYRLGPEEEEHLADMEQRISGLVPVKAEAASAVELAAVVPLIKVAWADGHITRREREMILDSLMHMDIPASEGNLRKLAEWLELRPDDEFFAAALETLREQIGTGDRNAAADRKYDILSRCTLVAEASGGSPGFAGGGMRICDEEIKTVKHIARILNGALTKGDK